MSSPAGTRDIHGGVYEFFRNDDLTPTAFQ